MKANELRIGNWLNWYSKYHRNGYFDKQLEIDDFTQTDLSSARPIPLTEEWLLKFGFEEEYSQLTNIYKYFLPNTPFGYCQGKFNVFTQTGCFSVETKHVHQLQNLYFALTGEELILK
jgi:hypothetical protein